MNDWKEFKTDAAAFYQSEIERCESTLKEYTVVFKVIPVLVIISALLILVFHTPLWRAIGITTIAMLTVIMLIDGLAHARMENYYKNLKSLEITTEHKK
jgi:hypothetical protein